MFAVKKAWPKPTNKSYLQLEGLISGAAKNDFDWASVVAMDSS